MPVSEEQGRRERVRVIALSFIVGIVLMVFKFYAYRITGSTAVLSDALESIINVVGSGFALVSVVVASRPPDTTHPYGHGKIEFFSAGFEGALIVLAAGGIFKTGVSHILDPRELPAIEEGLLLVFGVAVVNALLGVLLIRIGTRNRSLALIADGRHLLTDVITSALVLLGLLLVRVTGCLWVDGVVACVVGLYILVSGGRLAARAFSGLMDASDPGLLGEIAAILVRSRRDLWIDVHQLRTLRAGSLLHVDLHLILPRFLTLEEAHREAKDLEGILLKEVHGEARVLIHTDPCTDPDCPICRNHLCTGRREALRIPTPWSVETLVAQGGTGERLRNRVRDGDPQETPSLP